MKILFVCTGNTCRSPMAEVFCAARFPDWETRSRGLAAYDGAKASAHAIDTARERGCDLSSHEARLVTDADMEWADAVYGLTAAHASMLRTAFPAQADKVKLLGNIPDPIGGTLSDYRSCADLIEEGLAAL